MVKPKSFKQQSLGLTYNPVEVQVTVTTAANTATIVGTFKDFYGQTISERVHASFFMTTAYASYTPTTAMATATVSLENPLRPGTNPSETTALATQGYLYEFVTCSDGTATIVVSSTGTQNLFLKFAHAGRILEDYTAAVTFS